MRWFRPNNCPRTLKKLIDKTRVALRVCRQSDGRVGLVKHNRDLVAIKASRLICPNLRLTAARRFGVSDYFYPAHAVEKRDLMSFRRDKRGPESSRLARLITKLARIIKRTANNAPFF